VLKTIFLLAIILFQASCANNLYSLSSREKQIRQRSDFNAYLALEYLEYSRSMADKYNWSHSDYFAKKGLRAANNKSIYPEVPEAWYLDASQIEEATLSRQRLQLLLVPDVKRILPIQLAHLTMLYDCWISKEKNPWQLGDMSKCKTRFFALIDEMEKYLADLKPKVDVKTEEIKAPEFKKFDIYFDLDSYKFTEKANGDFLQLLALLLDLNGDYRILLVGAADRSGKELYNDSLARKRVLVAKEMLIKNGVPEDLIEINSLGETTPQILTKNNQTNKYNRRVAVYVLKGRDSLSAIPLPLLDSYIYKKEIEEAKKEKGIK